MIKRNDDMIKYIDQMIKKSDEMTSNDVRTSVVEDGPTLVSVAAPGRWDGLRHASPWALQSRSS